MARFVLCLLAIAFSVDLISARSEIPHPNNGMCPSDSCKRCKTDNDCDPRHKCCRDFRCNIWKCVYGKMCPPRLSSFQPCPRPCVHDNECNNGDKCCSQDCIKQCVKPVPKPPCADCHDFCPIWGQKCCYVKCKKMCIWPRGERCLDRPSKDCFECRNDNDCEKCETCVMRLDGCESKCMPRTVESEPAFCPAERHPLDCHRCKSDFECFFRRQICCDVGCGFRQCVAPGTCSHSFKCCNSDCECETDEKCCPDDCKFRCVKKVPKSPCVECVRDVDCPKWGQKCCLINCKRKCIWTRGRECPDHPNKPCLECEDDRDCEKCQTCVKDRDGCKSKCVPRIVEPRPEVCPVIPPFLKCRKCTSNGGCSRGQMCCSNDCGFRECVNRDLIEVESGKCQLSCCESDCDCERGEKCCESPCGKRCMKPKGPPRLCYNYCPCKPGLICCSDGCGNVCRKPLSFGSSDQCPPPDRRQPCLTECRPNASRCPRNLICCKTPCGYECLNHCPVMLE